MLDPDERKKPRKRRVYKPLKYEDYSDFHKNQIAKREQVELEKALAESRKLAQARIRKLI